MTTLADSADITPEEIAAIYRSHLEPLGLTLGDIAPYAPVARLFLEAGITGETMRRCDETDRRWLEVLEASELTALAQPAPW